MHIQVKGRVSHQLFDNCMQTKPALTTYPMSDAAMTAWGDCGVVLLLVCKLMQKSDGHSYDTDVVHLFEIDVYL